ncbi:hypothetical protein CICLE_v10015267mg [Citrus x clementina]|uniref:RCC1-like domain-containing protein n=1 Tax=Citrus clementina TaxID=85681 RepID=V4U5D1_CITCL|nr:hypothetical protein CICLE_v10015267mg [Citrus x clementina]
MFVLHLHLVLSLQPLEMMAVCGFGESQNVGSLVSGKISQRPLYPQESRHLLEKRLSRWASMLKVSFGWGHALAQTEDGKLFGWGYSADGRIGNLGKALESSPLDSNIDRSSESDQEISSSTIEKAQKLVSEGMEKEKYMPIIWEPFLVEGVEVVDIACGFDHSLVLGRNGVLLSCGSNVYGQLGREKQDMGMFPVDINFHPVSISSGLGHSLAICEVRSSNVTGGARGIVSWGWNRSSQLGRMGPDNVPLVVEGLEGESVASVSGGRAHSMALTSMGEVWTWGFGKNGRLGLGSSSDEAEPMLLDCLEGCEVLQAVSGFDHNLLLVAD